MCVSGSLRAFLWGHQSFNLGPTLIQYDFILTNYICKDLISTSGHIYNIGVQPIFWGDTVQPTTDGMVLVAFESFCRWDVFSSFWKFLQFNFFVIYKALLKNLEYNTNIYLIEPSNKSE